MPWLICGTVPDASIPLLEGKASLKNNIIQVANHFLPVASGSTALIAASCLTSSVLGISEPHLLLAGDEGEGNGSSYVYARLCEGLDLFNTRGISFHALYPDPKWQHRLFKEFEALEEKPLLVADAGHMLSVKMSGQANFFDLLTPNAGELAFLADENSPHPFYTKGILLADDGNTPHIISLAHKKYGAARNLLVKAKFDYIVEGGEVSAIVEHPVVPAMEAIGGTGDTISGIVSVLLDAEFSMSVACQIASLSNRLMAEKAKANPASNISDLLKFLPEALEIALEEIKDIEISD